MEIPMHWEMVKLTMNLACGLIKMMKSEIRVFATRMETIFVGVTLKCIGDCTGGTVCRSRMIFCVRRILMVS